MLKLHIDSVSKSYGNTPILSDVFINCNKGEIVGLIGRNGSGKSTLLKIIFGSETANFKFVRVGNKIIKNISDGRELINYLPQTNFLPKRVTVKSLIKLFLNKSNSSLLLDNKYIKPLLEKKTDVLSNGEKRLIEILLLIHSDAKFVLLDEPFNGMSPIMREYIVNYIKGMKAEKGYIITDHNYTNLISLSDKLFYINNGYVQSLKNKSELIQVGYLTQELYDSTYK